ncbi:MAG: DNA-binding protein [Pirellulaceae bacterium]|nr:DNA-binding protein [Pirellulaceae bacterium]
MARDSFLLRTDPQILDALRRWAEDEFRSANGQIEYLLRQALRDANRLEKKPSSDPTTNPNTPSAE